jgi:hypothetical protein
MLFGMNTILLFLVLKMGYFGPFFESYVSPLVGTKRWLEEHLDHDTTSDVLANVHYVLCLDTLGKDQ